jgi:hypothetical protein
MSGIGEDIQSFGWKREGEVYKVLVGKFKERDHLENHGIDGRIILKLI